MEAPIKLSQKKLSQIKLAPITRKSMLEVFAILGDSSLPERSHRLDFAVSHESTLYCPTSHHLPEQLTQTDSRPK